MNFSEAHAFRLQALEMAGHNIDAVPSQCIPLDLQSDSLIHRVTPLLHSKPSFQQEQLYSEHSVEELFKQYFGFPFVLAVSQGRLAEAILSQVMIQNGHYIPGSALFPTTRIHQERNGATPVEAMIPEAYNLDSPHLFKGNIDIAALELIIQTYHPAWIPYICVEPCNNAVGGHPMSLENMRCVSDLARHYQIPVYLDASRLIDNALLIQEREKQYQHVPVEVIIHEFCSYADGCTMSATKDFPSTIGGFIATRDPELFYRCLDQVALLGSGLNHYGKTCLARAMENSTEVYALIRLRIDLVRKLYEALEKNYPLSKPSGGHAVFINFNALNLAIPQCYYPEQAFLYQLFRDYGIRGSLNPRSLVQARKNISLVRFALPIIGMPVEVIEKAAQDISSFLTTKECLQGLELVEKGPGLTGFMTSKYRLVS